MEAANKRLPTDHITYPLMKTGERFPFACSTATLAAALDWMESTEEPWFAWVHLFDPHWPYAAPGRFARLYGGDANLAADSRNPIAMFVEEDVGVSGELRFSRAGVSALRRDDV